MTKAATTEVRQAAAEEGGGFGPGQQQHTTGHWPRCPCRSHTHTRRAGRRSRRATGNNDLLQNQSGPYRSDRMPRPGPACVCPDAAAWRVLAPRDPSGARPDRRRPPTRVSAWPIRRRTRAARIMGSRYCIARLVPPGRRAGRQSRRARMRPGLRDCLPCRAPCPARAFAYSSVNTRVFMVHSCESLPACSL